MSFLHSESLPKSVSLRTENHVQFYSFNSKDVVRVYNNVFTKAESDMYLKHFETLSSLKHQEILIMGKRILQPRFTASQALEGIKYTYSRLTIEPTEMDKEMLSIISRISKIVPSDQSPNYALINYYRNGQDYIGEHSDDEKGLDLKQSIVSISFGQERAFVMYEPKHTSVGKRRSAIIEIKTGHGQVIEMLPGCQQLLTHAVRQSKKPLGARINITLRHVAT